MKFSICIPNYNYGRYVGETIRSVLEQEGAIDVEVLVADNASTDDSVAVIEGVTDARVHMRRNLWNVGFAANLDRACWGATGERMILLSSDDLAGSGALATYARLADALGSAAERTVFCSATQVIDANGRVTGSVENDPRQWADAVEDATLSKTVGGRIVRVPARALLARAMANMRNPFSFATTCYPRALYKEVEGYGAGALINPDKAFAWKLLSVSQTVIYVDKPLFSYRVHETNQTAQQKSSGALKHLMDQYRATFDTAPAVLKKAELEQSDLAKAFIEHDVGLRGLIALAEGDRVLAKRHLAFGAAAYPALIKKAIWPKRLQMALRLGFVGTVIARNRMSAALDEYRAGGIL